MALDRNIKAGGATIVIKGDSLALERTLARVSKRFAAWGASLRSIGTRMGMAAGAGAGAALLAARTFDQAGSNLLDMSKRTGLSVEMLSELGYAAKQTGAEISDVETAAKFMNKAIADNDGTALRELGLSLEELRAASSDERFARVAQAIAAISDPSMRAAAALQVFGRSGTNVLPMLTEMNALRSEARQIGVTWTRAEAEAADAYGDSVTRVTASIKKAVAVIGGALAPVLTQAADAIQRGVKTAKDWISANQEVVRLALYGIAAFGALAAGVWVAGAALGVLATAFGIVKAALGLAVGTVMLLVKGLLLIATPAGAAAAAVGLLFGYIYASSDAGKIAINGVKDAFGNLAKGGAIAFQGIKDAMAAGDFGLAMQILGNVIELGWVTLTSSVSMLWAGFTTSIVNTFKDMWTAIKVVGAAGWWLLQRGWIEGVAMVKTLAAELLATYKGAVEGATRLMRKLSGGGIVEDYGEARKRERSGAGGLLMNDETRGALDMARNAENAAIKAGKSVAEAYLAGKAAYLKEVERANIYEAKLEQGVVDAITKQRDDALTAAEAERKRSVAAADQEFDDALVGLGQESNNRQDAAKADAEKRVAALSSEQQKLLGQLKANAAEAARKRREVEAQAGGVVNPVPVPATPQFDDIGDGGSKSLSPRGLFNINALQSLQGGRDGKLVRKVDEMIFVLQESNGTMREVKLAVERSAPRFVR
jgi:hypothetical protein